MSAIDVNQVLSELRAMAAQAQGVKPAGAAQGPDFAALMKNSIEQVSELQKNASAMATSFESGEGNMDLSEVMVALQKARISFTAMVEVRNKLVSAYQDIMNMPI